MKKKLKYLQGTCSNQSFKGNKIESESISKLLISNKSRFKCGSETGKKNSYWGLRKMCAPPLPSKYFPRGWGRWATGPKGDGKSCSLETYSKKNRKGLKDLSRNPRNPHLRRNQEAARRAAARRPPRQRRRHQSPEPGRGVSWSTRPPRGSPRRLGCTARRRLDTDAQAQPRQGAPFAPCSRPSQGGELRHTPAKR
mgnify:CR=1 FL=1